MKQVAIERATTGQFLSALFKLNALPWKQHPLRRKLVTRRRMFGICTYDVVHECGWNYLYVAQWESGTRQPTPAQLDAWIGALDRLTAEITAPCHRAVTHRAEAA